MTDSPRVLIVAEDDRLAGPLAIGLERLGWPVQVVRGAEGAVAAASAHAPEAVLVDLAGRAPALLQLPARLKPATAPRRLPVVALARPEPALAPLGFDLALAPALHPAQAALRLEALVRAAVSEEEAELRAATFAAAGRPASAPCGDVARLAVLTVGEPAPKFLALRHALDVAGAEVTGAFTAYTAFDYLHDRTFDAVVLWAGETHAEALSIAGGMRRNTRLHHTPTLLYLRDGAEVALSDAYAKGLSDVAGADTPEIDTAERVLWLARAHRRERAIRATLEDMRGSGLMDAATGLFTRGLFASHLARLATAAPVRRRPLSVAVLRIAPRGSAARAAGAGGWLERACPQIGGMLGRLVRAEDTPARLSTDVFAVAFPAARRAAAQAAAERIAAVIACTAFDAAEGDPPFTVEFDIGAAEVGSGETPASALERAAALAHGRAA